MLTPNRLVARKRISTPPRPSSLRLETLEDRIAPAVVGQLRIVDYNILNLPNSSAMTTVLQEIGNQSFTSNGTPIQRPIDVLLLQEVDSSIGGQAAQVRDLLNGLYGAGAYSLGTLQQSQASGGDRQAIVYRNSTVNLLGELEVTGASGPRAPMRYRLEADVAPGLDFYIYNSHYDAVDAPDRLSEANAIRANANALGNGVDILYVGDYNIDSSNEDMYDVALLGAGNGQAFDPINTPGTWHNASGFKAVHTQSTRVAVLPDGGASGGMDDRFDFILHTQEVGASGTASNGLGLEYRSGAYRAYGNNNTHTFNGDINSGSGFPAGLLDALRLASDHLPIVVDYDIVTPGGDTTPPTLLSMDDGDADNTVAVNATMTYTVTFSEDILNGSFTAADLNNAGTSTITVGTITETSNGVFSVQVTPTSAGTVLLRIPTGSVVEDVAGNDLVVPVQDNDTITALADPAPTLLSMDDGDGDDLVAPNTLLTYTVTFSEDILNGSFTAADLNNAGTASITLGTITETSPGVFSVQVTPTSAGTVLLRIPTGSVVEDVAGNDLVVPVQDDTTVNVDGTTPTLLSMDDGDADNTVTTNTLLTYTVTFSEDILNGSFTAADLNNAGTSTILLGTITETSNGVFSVQVTPTSAGTVLLRIPTGSVVEDVAGNDLVVPVQDNDTVTVTAPTTLQVTALTPHSNGFSATFNQVVNPADVNLYTQTGSPVGGPDVTLIGDGTDNTFGTADDVNVRGTLLFAAGNTQIRFLATGPVNSTGTAGTLAPDTYRVTLLSSSLAFKNGAGDLLDGDANGTAGGDYVGSFTVTAPTAGTVTVSLPDFARGPGQPASGTTIRIPANPSAGSQGLPLTLSEGFNVRELSLQLVWDPALLTLTSGGYVANAGSATFTVTGPGQGTLTQTAATQFSSTASQPFVAGWFTATIPTTAGYSSKNLLDLTVTSISDANLQPRPFRDDDAVHLVAYQGDTDGNGILNSADSIALQRVIVNYTTNTTGFEAYQNADPRVLADFNLDSVLNAGDAIALTVEVVGDSPLIEPRPAPLPPLQPGGPDPRLFIPDGIQVRAGQRSVLVPVRVENTNSTPISIATARIAVAYDPNVFVFRGATAGSVGDGSLGGSPFTVLADESSPGTLLLNGFTTTGPTLAVGQTETIFWLRFDVRRDAPSGTTDLNILDLAGTTALTNNEGQTLTLIPQPTDGIDVDDGSAIVRRGKQARRLERRGGSMRRR